MSVRPLPPGRLGSAAVIAATFVAASMCDGALALSLKPVASSLVEMRDGVVVSRPADKVSSPDLPSASSGSINLGQVVPLDANTPGGSAGSQISNNTYDIVADSGDAPGAKLCLAYRYSATVVGTVVSPTASVAGGIAGATGFSVSIAAAPATVTAPNPLVLTVTPLVGPVVNVFTVGPTTFASAASQTISESRSGQFAVQAGDTVTFNAAIGVAARAENPSGASSGTSAVSFSIGECSSTPVPALSPPSLAGLALLLLIAALAGGAARLRRVRR